MTRKSGRRKNNAGTHKEEEKKLAGQLSKRELPAEECCRRYGKWEEVCVCIFEVLGRVNISGHWRP